MTSILILTKDDSIFHLIRSCFKSSYRIKRESNFSDAIVTFQKNRYDIVFSDNDILKENANDKDYKSVFQIFWRIYPSVNIIVITNLNAIREAVMAVKSGAYNYICTPIDPSEVKLIIDSLNETLKMQSELDYLRDQFWKADALDTVKTHSANMGKVFEKIKYVAPTKSTVLLIGETGTGKGVLSRLIHLHSNRSEEQFISVHCGAIPDGLIESELFGHEKGAFSGAIRKKPGKFEIANGGTIFLDEISTITPAVQIKLLQILQEGFFYHVGGEERIDVNVRIIAATNADLKKMTNEGLFRKDLYYRLNVFPIEIPSFRERLEDIPIFIDLFLKRLNQEYAKNINGIQPQVLEAFLKYDWPGNIRELENLIERAFILEHSSVLTRDSFPIELFDQGTLPYYSIKVSETLSEVRKKGIEDIESRYLEEVLAMNYGKINASASHAGISTRQLHKLMKKYNLKKEHFKT